jgi:hypothetical protein
MAPVPGIALLVAPKHIFNGRDIAKQSVLFLAAAGGEEQGV